MTRSAMGSRWYSGKRTLKPPARKTLTQGKKALMRGKPDRRKLRVKLVRPRRFVSHQVVAGSHFSSLQSNRRVENGRQHLAAGFELHPDAVVARCGKFIR